MFDEAFLRWFNKRFPQEPQADDDYLEEPMPETGYWSYDPDFSCNPDE
jgi:hypothetical protein